MSSKGISGVIIALIVLLVSVGLAGGIYIWGKDVTTDLQESARQRVEFERSVRDASLAIFDVSKVPSGTDILVNNNGKVELDASKFNVFINGSPVSYSRSPEKEVLQPSESLALSIGGYSPEKCDFIRVTGQYESVDELAYADDGTCEK